MKWWLAAAGLAAAAVSAGLATWLGIPPPPLPQPPPTQLLLDTRGGQLGSLGPPGCRDARPLPLQHLGTEIVRATVAVEDERFFEHPGVDWLALARAAWHRLRGHPRAGGGSTITQQLVKRRDMPRSLLAKLLELRDALALERHHSKNDILEAYLNTLPYGHGLVGPEAAARFFFDKPAAELTWEEALFLAGLPQAPSRFASCPQAAERRFRQVVRRLVAKGLTRGDEKPPPRVRRAATPARAALLRLAAAHAAPNSRTHVVPEWQTAAERLVMDARVQDGAEAVIVVVENATGFVRALASTLERLPRRSTGSLLKPFVYAHALEQGVVTAASRVEEGPGPVFTDYQPREARPVRRGRVTVRQALACSLNRPAVAVLAAAGPRQVFRHLATWGFSSQAAFDERGAGFVLGNFEATPLEAAAAFAALARGGQAWDCQLVPGPPARIERAASAAACALVADILADPAARAPAFGRASPLELPFRAAVKTGTSSRFRDGWCAGFDGAHTVVVWRGRADGSGLGGRLAAQTAAPLWNRIMRLVHAHGSPPLPALEESGPLHRQALPRGGEEWFLAGTALPLTDKPPAPPRILFPRDGAVIEFSEALSTHRQRLIPRSEPPARAWLLNGERMDTAQGIALNPGRHTLTAIFESGAATVSFQVERP